MENLEGIDGKMWVFVQNQLFLCCWYWYLLDQDVPEIEVTCELWHVNAFVDSEKGWALKSMNFLQLNS